MNSTITEIDGLEFVKGTPFRLGPDTAEKVVIVEFWATWCPPCRDSIPHVSKLAQQYKEQNVIVIGITNEQDGEKVKQFVNSQGNSMDYTVAIDRKAAANRAFMVPTNTKGIPAAFILERNKLIHHSHPMDPAFATVLQAAVARSAASPPKALPLVTANRDELMQKPNKELRLILKERGISDKDCLEKGDFVDKIIKTCSQVQYYASS